MMTIPLMTLMTLIRKIRHLACPARLTCPTAPRASNQPASRPFMSLRGLISSRRLPGPANSVIIPDRAHPQPPPAWLGPGCQP